MNDDQLKRANELRELIQVTEDSIQGMRTIQEELNDSDKESSSGIIYYEGLYNFNISEHNDGSGNSAELCRYEGNAELLDVIINTLAKQLREFKKKFKAL